MELTDRQFVKLLALLEAQQETTKMQPWDIEDYDPQKQHRNRLLTMDRVGRF